jgi:RNA polymerase sigma-70 factor (ECF subfamily)
MSTPSAPNVTELLSAWNDGDETALDRLIPAIYVELRRLAHHYMLQEKQGHTLQTTALINEAYLCLINQNKTRWQNRSHFFAIAARLMRRILVDHARSHRCEKRGKNVCPVVLDEASMLCDERAAELIALDDALNSLASIDPRKNQIVELRYFGGLENREVAEFLGVSVTTIKREWNLAKAWLFNEIYKAEK